MTFGSVILQFKRELEKHGRVEAHGQWKIIGCTDHDIAAVMQAQNIKFLPSLYREFLISMGNSAGNAFRGSDYQYAYLLRAKDDANYLLRMMRLSLELPPDAFVFMVHQGYIFYFFLTASQHDDPAVFAFHEDRDEFFEVFSSFSSFLFNSLDSVIIPTPPALSPLHGEGEKTAHKSS